MEHGGTVRTSRRFSGHVAAESRICDLRWRLPYVSVCLCLLFSLRRDVIMRLRGRKLCWCLSEYCSVGSRTRSSVVDIYDVNQNIWSTAQLNEARSFLSATSLPRYGVAIFAGGKSTSCNVCLSCLAERHASLLQNVV
jgi:hypothetical protein